MLKTVSLFLIAVVLIIAGQYVNLRMKRRTNSLRELIVFVENIDSFVSYSKKTIQEIIYDFTFSSEVNLKILNGLINSKSENFSESWRKSVEKFCSDDCLNNEDKKILLSFGNSLGVTDIRGQNSNCRLHREMLEKQLREAELRIKEKTKVNTAVSFFLAMSVVIIFY